MRTNEGVSTPTFQNEVLHHLFRLCVENAQPDFTTPSSIPLTHEEELRLRLKVKNSLKKAIKPLRLFRKLDVCP